MTWITVLVTCLGGLGLIAGAYVAGGSPTFWLGMIEALFKAALPYIEKQMSPEDTAAYHEWIRQGMQGQFKKPSSHSINHAGENH